MAKTPKERGRIGAWLVDQRMARGWSTAAKARAELERLGGIRVAPSVYAEWESGSRLPSEANLARLETFYGSSPSAAPDQSDIVTAVREQTQVYRQMFEQFQRQADAAERRADMLEHIVLSLLAPAVRRQADPEAVRLLEQMGEAALESILSRRPEGDPAGGAA